MLLQNKFIGKNQVFISTHPGGKGLKIRYRELLRDTVREVNLPGGFADQNFIVKNVKNVRDRETKGFFNKENIKDADGN